MSQEQGDPTVSTLDDPALLAEIEAEFAELSAELERIHQLPRSMAPKKAELVRGLREQWAQKQAARPDRPEWRQRLDDALGEALGRILEDGIQETADGKLAFTLNQDSVQSYGGPLLTAVLDGFRHMLADKLKPAPAPAASAKPAAPPNPLQGLVVGLGQMLAQALDNTQREVMKRAAKQAAAQAAAAEAAKSAPAGASAGPSGAPAAAAAQDAVQAGPAAPTPAAGEGGAAEPAADVTFSFGADDGGDGVKHEEVTALHASVDFEYVRFN